MGEKYDTAKRAVGEGRERAQQAIDAGRRAAGAARSEFEEQVSEAREGRRGERAAEG